MFSIRQNFFETNSSSVHALVIPKNTPIHIPKRVVLQGGEYGWEFEERYDTLDYIYETCVHRGRDELEKFFAYLKRKGVEEIYAPEINWAKDEDDGEEYYYAKDHDGYVDHSEEVPLETLFTKEDLLDRFCFGEGSYVQTGTDNCDDDSLREKVGLTVQNEHGQYVESHYYNLDEVDVIEKYN